ncbi:MAG: hypothetical protein IJP11_06105 [Oscillospiraceae bacterium]|nr:hypothetical protein [Oscillospiraceae bacterium]
MIYTISALFGHCGNAKQAEAILRSHGYRVTLTHQQPKKAFYPGICPGSERYSPAVRAVMVPDRDSSVLTVLAEQEQDRTFVLDTIRKYSGRAIL